MKRGGEQAAAACQDFASAFPNYRDIRGTDVDESQKPNSFNP